MKRINQQKEKECLFSLSELTLLDYTLCVMLLYILYVAQKGHKDIVALLIERGADIDAASDVGSTPLYIASQKGNVEVVEYLLRHGANVDAKFKGYYTPLYIACQNGWLPIVKLLLNAGANIEGNILSLSLPVFSR
jgi:ankyrin repeat protein